MNQGLENKGAQGTHGSDVSHALAWFLAVRFMRAGVNCPNSTPNRCIAMRAADDTKKDSDYR